MENTVNISPSALDHAPCTELPLGVLRPEVQGVIRHFAEVYQCPREFVTTAVFAIAATLCGRRVIIDDGKYRNHAGLWVCHVARSGSNKSEPVKALLGPLREIDKTRYAEYNEAYKKAREEKAADMPVFTPLIITDTTPESQYQILAEKNGSHEGTLLYRDEIKGMLDDIGRYSRSGEISHSLSIWDGTSFTASRKTQKTIHVERPFLSVLGGIQPSVFAEAFTPTLAGVGYVQRWLFAYPEQQPLTLYSDKSIDGRYVAAWAETAAKLCDISDRTLLLSPEAKRVYTDFFNETKRKEFETEDAAAAMYSKLRIQVEKWCAVTHMLSGGEVPTDGRFFVAPSSDIIREEEMAYSVECMRYFEHCELRVLRLIGSGSRVQMTQADMISSLVGKADKVNITKLAEGLGVSRQYVSKVLNDKQRLRLRPDSNTSHDGTGS